MPPRGVAVRNRVPARVAKRQRLIQASPAVIWRVLSDAERYAEWVVGTRRITHADPAWPGEGACLEYTLGLGPLTFRDTCVVRVCEPLRRLELEALARPFGSARIAIELVRWGSDTVVIVDEHPLRGIGARLHGPPTEIAIHLRNRRMLANLAREAEKASADDPA